MHLQQDRLDLAGRAHSAFLGKGRHSPNPLAAFERSAVRSVAGTSKALLTQTGTRNSCAPSYASDA